MNTETEARTPEHGDTWGNWELDLTHKVLGRTYGYKFGDYFIQLAEFRTVWDLVRWIAHLSEDARDVITAADLGNLALAFDAINGLDGAGRGGIYAAWHRHIPGCGPKVCKGNS